MKIIQPTFDLINPATLAEGIVALRFIESMARISHRSEARQTDDSWQRFLQFVVIDKGDWSVVEHSLATVIFRVNRGVTHELVRHRLFAFTQESTRFVNYPKRKMELEFILPEGFTYASSWIGPLKVAEQQYLRLLSEGFKPQQARAVLPNALASTIAVSGNFRNWHHVLIMRTTQETHPDFLRVTIPLLEEFKKRIPFLFDDIIPGQKQDEALSKSR
jgi:thymidylate synthase (FAD)